MALYRQAANNVGGVGMGDPMPPHMVTELQAMDIYMYPDDPEAVPMEVATMRAVCAPPSCPWIIQLLDWYCGSSKTLLVLERPKQCMSLSEFARNNRWRLSEKQASLIFQQIVRAIQHCHARGVSHNSLNLDNILIEMPTEQVKVINFSYALFLEPEEGTRSAGFYAPLGCFLQDRRQTVPLTVKTLGVLLYEMLCGALTFGRELEIMHNIFTCERKLSIGEGERVVPSCFSCLKSHDSF
ncbi:PIM2 kinase, partial [Polypterus senegalus]